MKMSKDFPQKFYPYLQTASFSSNGSRVVFAYYLFDLIDIYDLEGKLVRRIIGPDFAQTPKVKASEVSFSSAEAESRYYDVYTTEGRIYALYYGFKESIIEDIDKRRQIYSRVLVLDWDGFLIDKIKIPGIVTSLCVNGDSVLYGLKPLNYDSPLFRVKISGT